jgi:hypothetical protein
MRAEFADGGQPFRSATGVFEEIEGVDECCGHAFGCRHRREFRELEPIEDIANDRVQQAVGNETGLSGRTLGRVLRDKTVQGNNGPRGKDDPIPRKFVLEVADKRRGWDDDPRIRLTGAQGFLEFTKYLCGFTGSGRASDEFHAMMLGE